MLGECTYTLLLSEKEVDWKEEPVVPASREVRGAQGGKIHEFTLLGLDPTGRWVKGDD